MVVIELGAEGSELVCSYLDSASVPEVGLVQRRIDHPRRAAESEQNGIGSALHFNTPHVVAIPWNIGECVVAGVVRARKSAQAAVGILTGKVTGFVRGTALSGGDA
jgi:23S rRNA C2498 (ribose-2'-O)-methylase RlmM